MKVHQSNYSIDGFTTEVASEQLAELARNNSLPFVNDLGSGNLVDLTEYGLKAEQTVAEALKQGADLVTISGDKLLGGPQAGIIVGRKTLIEKINTNPMKRALRCDKMTIAALQALLDIYQYPNRINIELPLFRQLSRPLAEVMTIAKSLQNNLLNQLSNECRVDVIESESEIGSGSMPNQHIPTLSVAISLQKKSEVTLEEIALQFRQLPTPVIGRIHRNQFLLDCRQLEDVDSFIQQLPALNLAE